MIRYTAAFLCFITLLLTPTMTFAKSSAQAAKHGRTLVIELERRRSPWAREVGWANQAGGKFVFGLKNALLGWTELFTEPVEAVNGGGNVFMGLGEGVWNAVGQTVGGTLHLVTFPITKLDIPLPEGGTKLL